MAKALLHLIPRCKAKPMLVDRLRAEVARLRAAKTSADERVNFLTALGDDPLGSRSHFAATIEVYAASQGAVATLLNGVGGCLGERLDDVIHADLSTALVGEERAFVAGDRAPVRYQYLMRRNAEFDHAAYLDRYRDIHSQFGIKTPGILSYVQFYVDARASQSLAAASGLGVWGVDSVSELHIRSVAEFLAEVMKSDIGAQAVADEEKFVDRERSVDFCSTVEWDDAAG